jgi:protein-tyrosine phosphatase
MNSKYSLPEIPACEAFQGTCFRLKGISICSPVILYHSTTQTNKGVAPQLLLHKLIDMKILMVCKGNICRSPLAEGILKTKAHKKGLGWFVDSAAIAAYHIGKQPHELSRKVALINGVDISDQKARLFTEEDLENFDIIYAMSADIKEIIESRYPGNKGLFKVQLIMNEMHPEQNENVPDPFHFGEKEFHEVYHMLDACSDVIIEKYKVVEPVVV